VYLFYVIVNIKEVLYDEYVIFAVYIWFISMSDNQKEPQYKLRWNEELRDKVMISAKENNRSINQEIIARLEQSFTDKNIAEEEVVALTSQVRQLLNRIEGGKL
jgi:phage gp37-like protein